MGPTLGSTPFIMHCSIYRLVLWFETPYPPNRIRCFPLTLLKPHLLRAIQPRLKLLRGFRQVRLDLPRSARLSDVAENVTYFSQYAKIV